METSIEKSTFSFPFNVLYYSGFIDRELQHGSPKKSKLYYLFRLFMLSVSYLGTVLLIIDFVYSFGNFTEMTWNLCSSCLYIQSLLENCELLRKNQKLNELRYSLHNDFKLRRSDEHKSINKSVEKEFKLISWAFTSVAIIGGPLWLSCRYFGYLWGSRGLPIPAYLPFNINMEDEYEYNVTFFIETIFFCLAVFYVIVVHQIVYSFLLPILREYRVLIKDFSQFNVYEDFSISKEMREAKAKIFIKEFMLRQEKLVQYVKTFENICNGSMLLRFFCGTLLITAIAFQCLVAMNDKVFAADLSYNILYAISIVLDLLMLSLNVTKLKSLSERIGDEAYFIVWYKMNKELQINIRMLMQRSKNAPRVTTGKIMDLNLNAFLHAMRNIYSCLTLIRQLQYKNNID